MNCINCSAITPNPKFCSKSCAASYNNKLKPKRKRRTKCRLVGCESITKSYRHTLCCEHWAEYLANQHVNKPLSYFRNLASVKGKHASWANVHVRLHARNAHRTLLKQPCAKCGYSKHVELCHIKAVTSFPETATLREVNDVSNVVQLCRNCHWEFDNLPREDSALSD